MNDLPSTSCSFLRDFDAASERLHAAVATACPAPAPWPARVAAAIVAALEFADDDPAATRLLFVEAWGQGPPALARRRALLERFEPALAAGRAERPQGAELPALTEQLLLGALAGQLSSRLLAGEQAPLAALASGLTELVLLPYLGAAEARAWARRSRPPGA
jgi:hypothetical protein